MKQSDGVSLSAIDEERFGIRVARTNLVTAETWPTIMDFCRANQVKMLIARCYTSEIAVTQAMERAGSLLMDTLVVFSRDLVRHKIPDNPNQDIIRLMRPGDEDQIRRVAARAFDGYSGHYHADSRLDKAKCDEAYISWAMRSCLSKDVADDVFVAAQGDAIIGFITMQLNTPEEGQAVIGGVLPEAQGKGLYRSFLITGMEWLLAKQAATMVVSTQITNIAVQKVWVRLGFEPRYAFYTFHKWFDD